MSNEFEFVDETAYWARSLVMRETRSRGDYLDAMRRVADHVKVPFALLWGLHYRRPKTVSVGQYVKLGRHFADVQRRKYRAERATTDAQTELGRMLLGAADSLAGEKPTALIENRRKAA